MTWAKPPEISATRQETEQHVPMQDITFKFPSPVTYKARSQRTTKPNPLHDLPSDFLKPSSNLEGPDHQCYDVAINLQPISELDEGHSEDEVATPNQQPNAIHVASTPRR